MRKLMSLVVMFALLSGIAFASYLVDPSLGLNGKNYSANYQDMVDGALLSKFNTTITFTSAGVTYLTIPEFDSSTACLETNLDDTYTGGSNWTLYEIRSDIFSEGGIVLAASDNPAEFDAWYNVLVSMNLCGYGTLPCWVVLRNGTVFHLGSANDTALDGDVRAAIALYIASKNPSFSEGNRTKYLARARLMVADVYRYDTIAVTSINTRSGRNVTRLPMGGADCAGFGLACGTDMWEGYGAEVIMLFQYAYNDTQNATYDAAARDFTAAFLSVNLQKDTDGDGFGVAPFNFNWDVTGPVLNHTNGGGVNTYHYNASNPQWDDSDSPRFEFFCNVPRLANTTGQYTGVYVDAAAYCGNWSRSATMTNVTSCLQYYYNGTCGVALSGGYYQNGLGSTVYAFTNTTLYPAKINEALGHYGWSGNTYDSTACGTALSYRGVRPLRSLITALNLDFLTVSAGGGGGSVGSINVSLNGPVNGSTLAVSTAVLNVTVWNLNVTDGTSVTPGTLPQILYNSTFSATPSNDGWTLNSWTWTANGGGVINNTANSGAAAWTQNLSLTQMTNGYNVTLNMSMGNFTNGKIFFGTNSGTQDGDRVLIERSGNSMNIKHDGGSFGSFTVGMNQYVTINIFVNLTNNTVRVSSGASSWTEALANSHLTINGSYIAFVPGQNMTGNQNSTGWNISSINVTNVGKPYNVTTPVAGNTTLNVSFYASNGTLLSSQPGVANASSVTYAWTGLADASYQWYATVRTEAAVVNSSTFSFTVDAVPPPPVPESPSLANGVAGIAAAMLALFGALLMMSGSVQMMVVGIILIVVGAAMAGIL